MTPKRYIEDENGNRTAVILDIREYHDLLKAAEQLELLRTHQDNPEPAYTPEEKQQMEDRLKSLGYL